MSLTLLHHPLSSFCMKALIALYENGTLFAAKLIQFGDAAAGAELRAHWPVGKIPVLLDGARGQTIPEATIIIEYLDRHFRGAMPLLPSDPEVLLQVRLWDRFFDNYLQHPMQKIVIDRVRPEGARDPQGVQEARAGLRTAYGALDKQLTGKVWATGEAFTMADCAATPALFYAGIVEPFGAGLANLAAYFERLMARPSVMRVIAEARPYFANFPYRDAMPERFLQD